jgi:ATP-dependent helicase/nuclease subunit B
MRQPRCPLSCQQISIGVKDIEQALIELVSAFDDEARAYDSEPDSENRPRFSDYRHLARVREWRPEEGPGD